MYLEILNRFYDIEADVKDLEKVLNKINAFSINLDKIDVLKQASEELHKQFKNGFSDKDKKEKLVELFNSCIKEVPKFKKSKSTKALYDAIVELERLVASYEKVPEIKDSKISKLMEDEDDSTAVDSLTFFKEKYIDSGILPDLPENNKLSFNGKEIICDIGYGTYKKIIETYLSIIIDKKYSGYKDAEEYLAQGKRFFNITKNIFDNYKDEFFDYYPFTTKKEFKKTSVVIADSGIMNYCNMCEYTRKASFKLVITPEGAFRWNGNYDKFYVSITEDASSDKTPPIFDMDNVPSKPVKVRAKHIDAKELVKGHIYIEKPDGTKLVYLGIIEDRHCYIRSTKKLDELAKDCTDITDLLKKLLEKQYEKDEYAKRYQTKATYVDWNINRPYCISGMSCRTNPRKFIADVGQLNFKEKE